jgi:hypothetical protein
VECVSHRVTHPRLIVADVPRERFTKVIQVVGSSHQTAHHIPPVPGHDDNPGIFDKTMDCVKVVNM